MTSTSTPSPQQRVAALLTATSQSSHPVGSLHHEVLHAADAILRITDEMTREGVMRDDSPFAIALSVIAGNLQRSLQPEVGWHALVVSKDEIATLARSHALAAGNGLTDNMATELDRAHELMEMLKNVP